MPCLTLLETAYHSEAITILNHMRHCLTGRRYRPLSGVQRRICQKAFSLDGDAPIPIDSDDLAPAMELNHALRGAASSLAFDDETRQNAFRGVAKLVTGDRPDPAMQQALIHLVERSMDSIADTPAVDYASARLTACP